MLQPSQFRSVFKKATFAKSVDISSDACGNGRLLSALQYLSKYFRCSFEYNIWNIVRRYSLCADSADVAHGAFLEAGPVIEFLGKVLGRKLIPGENTRLTSQEFERVGPD